MNPARTIARKRDGHSLTSGEIADFVEGFQSGAIPDYQMSALAMAICLRGMGPDETFALTDAMLNSGTALRPSAASIPRVDKHSTGGVGDKVSLILAPLLACCDLQVPMLSGCGLGPTGGTLDKLSSIPGFRTDLTPDEIHRLTASVGCVITGATNDVVPADRRLYALRDVTGTVACIPLISASIMSKKLAESLDALVLDVKHGSGAFMKSVDDALQLARSLVQTGTRAGVATTALLTDMNQPLGRMAGNSLELNEALDALRGAGPHDLVELVHALGCELLTLTNLADSCEEADGMLSDHIASGRALEKFEAMVRAQGGDPQAARPIAAAWDIAVAESGYVESIDTEALGYAVIALGGGRRSKRDVIDHSVGLEMLVRIGERVEVGQPMVRVFGSAKTIEAAVRDAITVSDRAPAAPALIVQRIEATT